MAFSTAAHASARRKIGNEILLLVWISLNEDSIIVVASTLFLAYIYWQGKQRQVAKMDLLGDLGASDQLTSSTLRTNAGMNRTCTS
eukprot:scaffold992_cov116-Cylindrotheca_fusiformis.AAC.8